MASMTKLFLVAFSLVALISCGKNGKQIISSVNYETIGAGDEAFFSTDFNLDLGNTELPFFFYEVPKNLGTVLVSGIDGKNYVNLTLNLSEVAKLPANATTLPNGTPLPVVTNAGIIEIPIDKINGKIYVSIANNDYLVGFAFSLKELDKLGEEIGKVNFFQNFTIKKVKGTAGVYIDDIAGHTGIGAFAYFGSASKVYNFVELRGTKAQNFKARALFEELLYSPNKIQLNFN